MTDQEFSNQFDLLYNNITSNQAPGVTEYEKSVFLTKAQDEVLKNYFNPKGNKYAEGYDGNQKRQIDFSMITVVDTKDDPSEFTNPAMYDSHINSATITLKDDIMMIINEKVTVTRTTGETEDLIVVPVSFDEYDRLMSKPFKRPLKYQAWRLINHDLNNTCDLIVGPGDVIHIYRMRYIKKPAPIIVGELDDLTIDGYEFGEYDPTATPYKKTKGCRLDSILHEEILQRAVEIAKIAWQGDINASLQSGQRSE